MDLSGGILIVDDSSTSRMIIQRCIEMAGFEPRCVYMAENGIEAISLLRAHPDLRTVLTDINMPKMDGKAFVRTVKGDPALEAVQVVVVSSIADAAIEAELKSLGVETLVKKPVSPQKFKDAFGGAA